MAAAPIFSWDMLGFEYGSAAPNNLSTCVSTCVVTNMAKVCTRLGHDKAKLTWPIGIGFAHLSSCQHWP